jgi:hypothetical protein
MANETGIALYKILVDTHPASQLKGDTIPYTSINGHMYSYFNKDGFLALRLPENRRVEFIEKYNTTLVTAYGIVQKEYVAVPLALLQQTEILLLWLEAGYTYVASLKPKPSKSRKQLK